MHEERRGSFQRCGFKVRAVLKGLGAALHCAGGALDCTRGQPSENTGRHGGYAAVPPQKEGNGHAD